MIGKRNIWYYILCYTHLGLQILCQVFIAFDIAEVQHCIAHKILLVDICTSSQQELAHSLQEKTVMTNEWYMVRMKVDKQRGLHLRSLLRCENEKGVPIRIRGVNGYLCSQCVFHLRYVGCLGSENGSALCFFQRILHRSPVLLVLSRNECICRSELFRFPEEEKIVCGKLLLQLLFPVSLLTFLTRQFETNAKQKKGTMNCSTAWYSSVRWRSRVQCLSWRPEWRWTPIV